MLLPTIMQNRSGGVNVVLGYKDHLSPTPTGHVAQWLVRQNSNLMTLGLIPWWGRVSASFSVPLSQLLFMLTCLCLTTPLCVYSMHQNVHACSRSHIHLS